MGLLTRFPLDTQTRQLYRECCVETGLPIDLLSATGGQGFRTPRTVFLPERIVIHMGEKPESYTLAHELAHVLLAKRNGVVAPRAMAHPRTAAFQRELSLLFFTLADLFVDLILEERLLLPPDRWRTSVDGWKELARSHDKEFCPPSLAPFYRNHARVLRDWKLPRSQRPRPGSQARKDGGLLSVYRRALRMSGPLPWLSEALFERFLPKARWWWMTFEEMTTPMDTVPCDFLKASPMVPVADERPPLGRRDLGAILRDDLAKGRHFALLAWDFKGLGRLNASHGRSLGDEVIARVGSTLSRTFSANWFRLSGDEGIVPIPNADRTARRYLLGRARAALRGVALTIPVARPMTVDLALALVFHPSDGRNLDELLPRLEMRLAAPRHV